MIPHLKNIPYEEQLAKLKLWSLEDHRVHADLTEVFTPRRNARIASAVLATAIPSVCLSVRLSVTCRYCDFSKNQKIRFFNLNWNFFI